MNKPVEITMEELHIGMCKTVVSMKIDGDLELDRFMENLMKSNLSNMESLHTAMDTICSEENYTNKTKFRYISEEKIYEIKSSGIRLYCFQDRLNNGSPCLIIVTHGGKKNTAKEQNRDIKKSSQIRQKYMKAKREGNIQFNYISLDLTNQQNNEN